MQSVTHSLSVTYEAQPNSVAQARAALAEFAVRVGANEVEADAVRLAVSEAVTNAVVHAYRGNDGEIQIAAALTSDELWVLVSDDGCGMQPRADRPGLGLGLGLIAQVSDQLAIVQRSGGGTELRIGFKLSEVQLPPGATGTAHDATAGPGPPLGLPAAIAAFADAPRI